MGISDFRNKLKGGQTVSHNEQGTPGTPIFPRVSVSWQQNYESLAFNQVIKTPSYVSYTCSILPCVLEPSCTPYSKNDNMYVVIGIHGGRGWFQDPHRY